MCFCLFLDLPSFGLQPALSFYGKNAPEVFLPEKVEELASSTERSLFFSKEFVHICIIICNWPLSLVSKKWRSVFACFVVHVPARRFDILNWLETSDYCTEQMVYQQFHGNSQEFCFDQWGFQENAQCFGPPSRLGMSMGMNVLVSSWPGNKKM